MNDTNKMQKMMFFLGWHSALTLLFLSLSYQITSAKIHYGFQSGTVSNVTNTNLETKTNDDSFASSLHYDSQNGLLFITGGTYSRFWNGIESSSTDGDMTRLVESDCFMTILKVPQDVNKKNNGGVDREMKMIYARRFGKEDTPEACSAVMYMPSVGNTARAIALGNTEEGGLLTSLRSPGSRKASLYGFMMDFNIELGKRKGKVVDASGKVDGGRLMYDFPIQYPIAITTDPLAVPAKEMYTALLVSPVTSTNKQQQGVHPDLTLMDDKIENGQDFRIVIEMSEAKSQATLDYEREVGKSEDGVQETIVGGWTRSFSPNLSGISDAIASLQVSDLIYVPRMSNGARDDVLVLTGSTNGHGPEFGGPEAVGSDSSYYGFVTKLSPTDGGTDPIKDRSVATARVGLVGSEDSINGVCFQKGIADVEFIYVVGFTRGLLDSTYMQEYQLSVDPDNQISKHAYVTKLRLHTLEQVWSRQLGSQYGENIIGHGCDVSMDGTTVYLAGTIKDGGSIRYVNDVDGDSKSAGGDDLFVASYASSGNANFVRQFGTAKDDTFARGKSIVCDEDGNAIVLGNTRGSLMRLREDKESKFGDTNPSDIFVMSIGKEKGKMPSIAEKSPEEYIGRDSINSIPISSEPSEIVPQLFTVEIVAITISSTIMFLTIVYAACNWRRIKKEITEGIEGIEGIEGNNEGNIEGIEGNNESMQDTTDII